MRRARPAAVALALTLAACAAPLRPPADAGARAAALAAGFVGTPYRYGGAAPDGFDCSGLVWFVYHAQGIEVPRTAVEQRSAVHRVAVEALRPGDLLFFYTPADHVGLYLGGQEFVHAPSSGRSVERARLDAPFYILGFAGAGRLVKP